MKQAAMIGILVLLAGAAHAELPPEILNADYKNCVGTDNDPNRATYCTCVRDGMKGWSVDEYGQVVAEAAAAKPGNADTNGGAVPAKIAGLAKECIAKVLH